MRRCLNATNMLGLFVIAGAVCGCGKSAQDPAVTGRQQDLTQIYELYSGFNKRHQKPPMQVSEFSKKELDIIYPGAGSRLRSGDYTVVWGTNVGKGETSILAYEKSAPQSGGTVLLADGTIKIMSADDLQAAIKHKG